MSTQDLDAVLVEPMNGGKPATAARAAAASKKPVSWAATCVTAMLFLNSLLLVAVLVVLFGIKSRVEPAMHKVEKIVSSVESGEPTPELLSFTNKVLSSGAEYFFLGSFDGTLSGYLKDLLRYDFASFAGTVKAFGASVASVFDSQSERGYEKNLHDAGALVASVAGKVEEGFKGYEGGAPAANPALSDGIFRVDHVLDFIKANANATAWRNAATTCKSFSATFSSVAWYGSYEGAGSLSTHTWDWRSSMQSFTEYLNEICGRLEQLP